MQTGLTAHGAGGLPRGGSVYDSAIWHQPRILAAWALAGSDGLDLNTPGMCSDC